LLLFILFYDTNFYKKMNFNLNRSSIHNIMSKFHLSKELTDLISNAVQAFALRIESEFKVSKEKILEIWEESSEDIITPQKKTKKATEVDKLQKDATMVKQLIKTEVQPRRFALRKNKCGNYEHSETQFVFDPQTKEVFGKQVGDEVQPLRLSDIELCNQFGFKFKMPEKFDDDVVEIEAEISDVEDDEEVGSDNE